VTTVLVAGPARPRTRAPGRTFPPTRRTGVERRTRRTGGA
jgi:hypothetical protein